VISSHARIQAVEVSGQFITAHLAGGRTIRLPLAWSRRLAAATPEQRAHYEIVDGGRAVRWPEIDERISACGMIEGAPSRRRTMVTTGRGRWRAVDGRQPSARRPTQLAPSPTAAAPSWSVPE